MPKRVLICGVWWKVIRRHPRAKKTEMGWCDYQTQTIYVKIGLPKPAAQETLLHEIEHAILFTTMGSYGYRPVVERVICGLNPMLLTTLQENGDLSEYLDL